MKKLFSLVALLSMAFLMFSACTKDNISKDKLIGKWKVVKHMQYYGDEWHEANGGTGAVGASFEFTSDEMITEGGPRTYKLNGNKIEFEGGYMGEVDCFIILSLTDKEMVWELHYPDDQVDKLTLERQ